MTNDASNQGQSGNGQQYDYWNQTQQYPPQQYQPYYPAYQQYPQQPPVMEKGGFKRGFGLGSGAGLGAALTFLALGLVGTLLSTMLMATLLSSATDTGSTSVSRIWGSPSATSTLRSIEVTGPIMGNASDGSALVAGAYGYEIAAMLDELEASDADGVILEMNTPGGTIYGARAIADGVKRYQERTGKKVLAYVRGISASGGMYAMAGADEIVADHGTLVGSIGVIMGPISRYRDVMAIHSNLFTQGVTTRGGITQEYLSQGKGKDFGNPYQDMPAEDRAIMMRGLADEYDAFVNHVSTERGIPAATIKNTLGARVFGTKQAIANKLIDAEMGQEEAYRRAAELNGLNPDNTKIEQEQTAGLMESLLGADSSRVRGQAPAATSNGNGPPVATSIVCTGRTLVMAYAGDKTSVCG